MRSHCVRVAFLMCLLYLKYVVLEIRDMTDIATPLHSVAIGQAAFSPTSKWPLNL